MTDFLTESQVAIHPFIMGELACGNLRNRDVILNLLGNLPQVDIASHQEVMHFIQSRKLFGKGIGWIDAHLLASCLISRIPLWTADRKLKALAKGLNTHI